MPICAGHVAHLTDRLLHLRELLGDGLEALVQALFERRLQLLIDGPAHLFELLLVAGADFLELCIDLGAQLFLLVAQALRETVEPGADALGKLSEFVVEPRCDLAGALGQLRGDRLALLRQCLFGPGARGLDRLPALAHGLFGVPQPLVLLLAESLQRRVDRLPGARDRFGRCRAPGSARPSAARVSDSASLDVTSWRKLTERGLHVAAELRDRVLNPGELLGLRPAALLNLVERGRQPVARPLRDLRQQGLRELVQIAAQRLGVAVDPVEPRQHDAAVGRVPAAVADRTTTSTQTTSPAFSSASPMTMYVDVSESIPPPGARSPCRPRTGPSARKGSGNVRNSQPERS